MTRLTFLLIAAAVGWATLPTAARADSLDKKLNEEMPKIMAQLHAKGYKTVGVLPFQAQRGKKASGFAVGPINNNMAERLENLMVIHGGPAEDKAVMVLREVGATAARAKANAWSTSAAGRKALFDLSCPTAWGNKKAKADAFLTGSVRCVGDREKTTVVIQAFDRKDPAKLVTIAQFAVETDRSLVRDLGSSFNLTPKTIVAMRGKPRAKADQILRRSVLKREDPDTDPTTPGTTTPGTTATPDAQPATDSSPSNVGGIEVKILVGAEAKDQAIRESSSGAAKWEVNSPPSGQPVIVTLKNTSDKKRGVVLKFNGVSTVLEQKDPSDQCRKWVLEAGKTFQIKGFYGKGDGDGDKLDKVKLFKVLEGEEAKPKIAEFGDKAGLIEVDVFEDSGNGGSADLMVSARKVVRKQSRGSYLTLRSALMKGNFKSKLVNKREIIVADEAAIEIALIKVVDFAVNPTPVGSLKVKIVPKEPMPTPAVP